MLELIIKIIALLSGIATLGASSIAIWVYFTKRKSISSVFSLLLNYSHQLTLSDLKENLKALNQYNADNEEEYVKIVNILHDIIGQISGNERLKSHLSSWVVKAGNWLGKRGTYKEARKRNLVSELREKLRNLNVGNIDDLIGGSNE